jgi:hypothetical protein
MKPTIRFALTPILAVLLMTAPATAYEYPLSSTAIRDAYFLGKASTNKRAESLAKYTVYLPMPKSGPYVAVVVFETPYVIVTERTARALSGYFAQDAEEEFLGKPGVCRVRIRIYLTSSYSWQLASPPGEVRFRPDDFWREFSIRLVQDGQEITAKASRGSPLYSLDLGVLTGAEVDLEYDAAKIQSAPATVEVDTPDGQHVQTTFDLTKLR